MRLIKLLLLTSIIAITSGCTSSPEHKTINNENKEKLYIETNNTTKLIEYYKLSLQENDNADTRIKLAQSYLNIGDYDSSIFVLSQIKMEEMSTLGHQVLARTYLRKGDYKKAQQQAEILVGLDKNIAESYNILGICAVKEKEFVVAIDYFNQAKMHFYNDEVVRNNIALVYLLTGQLEKSYELINYNHQRNPNNEQTMANLVLLLIKLNKIEVAQDLLRKNGVSEKEIDTIIKNIENRDLSIQ
ncbi:TPA: hypothetical protein RQK84_000887 [Vibrio vulnificus]|nr:hypothetical protein [Vibrio vulnificus]HDY8012857.1 hypothetical protein [Vibrio vulnificus]